MKKKMVFKYIMVFLTSVGISVMTSNAFAQEIKKEQVQFEKGSNSAIIESSITGYETIDYILNVRKGQYINVSMATDNTANYFNILEPNEDNVAIFNGSIGENMYESTLNKSGNYSIRVYLVRSAARRNEKANYRLEMIVSNINDSNKDAKVAGTNYNATGKIPCHFEVGKSTANCDFGVVREGNGTARVTITKPDGTKRTIFFESGKAVGYDDKHSNQDSFKATKKDFDLHIIQIGNEKYEIPDAVIFGG